MLKLLLALVALVTVCGESLATADAGLPSQRAEAKRLRDLGVAAFDRGDVAEALAQFQRANQLFASPNLSFNIGVALDRLGRLDEAVAAFEVFVEATQTPDNAREYASGRLRELMPRIARVALTVTPANAKVCIDGRDVRWTPGREVPLVPGPHTITAGLEGYTSKHVAITCVAGERTLVSLTLSAVARPAPAPAARQEPAARLPQAPAPPSAPRIDPAAPRTHHLRNAAIGVGAFAVVGLALGAVFADRAVAVGREVNSPAQNAMFDPSLVSRGRTYQALDQTFFILGGAAAAGSVVLGVLAARRER